MIVLLWNCLSQCLGESTSLLLVGALVLKHKVLVFLSREEYCIAFVGVPWYIVVLVGLNVYILLSSIALY
jgi:hypothetical protein